MAVLEYAARDEIYAYFREERLDHERVKTYLEENQVRPKGKTPRMVLPNGLREGKPHVPRRRKKKGKEEPVEQELLCAAYDGRTPDIILMEQEEEAKPRKTFNEILDCVCNDIYDRLLLGMRGPHILTETEMGELYGGQQNGLGRDAVHRRLHRMHRVIQKELGCDPDFCAKHCTTKGKKRKGKRCSKKPEKRELAEEVLASWRCLSPDAQKAPNHVSVVPAPHFLVNRRLSANDLAASGTESDVFD